MPVHRRLLVTHVFRGGRFADHGIDLDVLPDLLCYREILVEVAKELWRRNHPDKERLPKNFEDSLSLKFYEVRHNCATIPLERRIETDGQKAFVETSEDELDDAVQLVAQTIDAVSTDQAFPADFPKGLIHLFSDYGKTLRDDEYIEQIPAGATTATRYDHRVRERFANWIDATYDDSVDLVGEVTMARVRKPRVAIALDDGHEVEAQFRPEDEEVITTALQKHTTARLRIVGQGQFTSDGRLQRITSVSQLELLISGERPYDSSVPPIWERFATILASVPSDELAKLPADGAENHDAYIYGRLPPP
jgi:hypothetical protein